MDFHMILNWVYPVIDLAIIIFSLNYIKNVIGTLLASAFGLNLMMSIAWRLPEVFAKLDMDISSVYGVLSGVNVLVHIVAAALIIVAIIKISELLKTTGQDTGNPGATGSPMANLDSIQIDTIKPLGNIFIYLLPLIFGLIVMFGALLMLFDRHDEDQAMVLLLFGLVCVLFSSIYFLVVLYRLWSYVIQASKSLGLTPSIETAGKAVGFLFIPIFSYYWMFIACGKLPVNLNAVARKKGVASGISDTMGMLVAVFAVLSIIPVLGYVTGFVLAFILIPIFIHQSVRTVRALQGLKQDQTHMIDFQSTSD